MSVEFKVNNLQKMLCSSRVMAGMVVRGGRRGLATTSKKAASYSVQVGTSRLVLN